MSRVSPVEALLVLLIALGIGAHFALHEDPGQRNYVFAPDMYETPAYESQDPNPHFADGKTLQAPAPGTIARGYMPLYEGDVILDTTTPWKELGAAQKRAWDEHTPPWDFATLDDAGKAAVLARGQHVYETFCATCHGGSGKGDGLVTKRGVPPPKSFSDPEIAKYSDGHMFRSVSFGSGNMAAYESQVEREDRWKAIRYIRSLQQAP